MCVHEKKTKFSFASVAVYFMLKLMVSVRTSILLPYQQFPWAKISLVLFPSLYYTILTKFYDGCYTVVGIVP